MAKARATKGSEPSLRVAVDAFLSSSRCANPNTRRAYTTVLERVLADLGDHCCGSPKSRTLDHRNPAVSERVGGACCEATRWSDDHLLAEQFGH